MTIVEAPTAVGPTRPGRRLLGATLPLQLFLAAGWLRAGVEKVIAPDWWTGDSLRGFLEEQRPHMLPWFRPLADGIFDPLAPVVAWAVLWIQLGIGACLLTNRHVQRALWAGIALNVCFVMAGRVNPSAFYLVMEVALLFALSRAVGETIAVRRAIAWLVPATLLAPFARSLHPAAAIDDPALMLAFLCVIAAITTIVTSIPLERIIDIAERHPVARLVVATIRRIGISAPRVKTANGRVRDAGPAVRRSVGRLSRGR
jgi:thiosulfate dehydrogenase [quinone] large subunit